VIIYFVLLCQTSLKISSIYKRIIFVDFCSFSSHYS